MPKRKRLPPIIVLGDVHIEIHVHQSGATDDEDGDEGGDLDCSNPIGFDQVGPTEEEFYDGDYEGDPYDAPPL